MLRRLRPLYWAVALASVANVCCAAVQSGDGPPAAEVAAAAPPFSIVDVVNAARPAGALVEDIGTRVTEEGGDFVVQVQADRAPFRWRIRPRGGHPLAVLSIEDEGASVEPLHSAYIDPLEGKLELVGSAVEGGRTRIRYAKGLELTWGARGRSMSVEVSGALAIEIGLGGLQPILPAGAKAQILQVPYNDHGSVAVVRLADGQLRFLSAWFDPVLSNATQLKIRNPGERGPNGELYYSQFAQYRANTEGAVRELRERIWITWSDRLLDVLPCQVRPASPAREWSGQRYYVDYHHTPFEDAARDLRLAHACGVRDLVIWMRQWQRDGYDTGYPTSVLPPREQWGGLAGLRDVRRAAGEAGYDFGLGHNWVFNTEGLPGASALDSDGSDTYFDGGGRRLKPAAAVALVDKVEGGFHDGFLTSGTYSDSITATYPTIDLDAENEDWGLLREVLEDWGQVLDRLRAIHGPPVAGEGALRFGNLFWAGVADVTTGMPGMVTEDSGLDARGRGVPIVPHYRLRRLHPLHVHAGLGSPSVFLHPNRDYKDATYTPADRDVVQTLCTLYGLAGYSWWWTRASIGDLVRDWWSTAATRGHLAGADMILDSVEYVDLLGRFVDLEGLLVQGRVPKLGTTRVRLRWRDGSEVWANFTPLPWELTLDDGRRVVLPTMGRLVLAPELESGLVVEGGATVEYARTATTLFLDARGGIARLDGVEVAGAVALRFEQPGLLEVIPLPDYLNGVDAERNERHVRTTRIRLDGDLLDARVGEGPLEVRSRGLGPQGNRLVGTGLVDVERGADGSIELRLDQWQSIGASALLIRSATTTEDE